MATYPTEPPPPSFPRLQRMGAWLSSLDYVAFDRTLASARQAIGSACDPSNPTHASRLRQWLNEWGCRIRYPRMDDTSDPFTTNLAAWWRDYADNLPTRDRSLTELNDVEIGHLAEAYDDLRRLVVSPTNLQRRRRIGSTAAAKLLYFLRSNAVTAWDRQIAGCFGAGYGAAGFCTHLTRCRGWAELIVAEAMAVGVSEDMIGPAIGRPDSSVAKLLDEYLYEVVSRGKRF